MKAALILLHQYVNLGFVWLEAIPTCVFAPSNVSINSYVYDGEKS